MAKFEILIKKIWGSQLKIFDFLWKCIRVVKWCIWAPGTLISVFWIEFKKIVPQCKTQKFSKIPKNTDQVFRSVFIFFEGAKLPQNETEPNSNTHD